MSWIEGVFISHNLSTPIRSYALHYDALDAEPRWGDVRTAAVEAIRASYFNETAILSIPPWLLNCDFFRLNRGLADGLYRCLMGTDSGSNMIRSAANYNIRASMLQPKLSPVFGDAVVWFESSVSPSTINPLCISSREIDGAVSPERSSLLVNSFLRNTVAHVFSQFTSVKSCRDFFTTEFCNGA